MKTFVRSQPFGPNSVSIEQEERTALPFVSDGETARS